MRRILTVLAVAAVAGFVVAGVAVAQEELAPEHPHRPGKALTASGDGTATLDVERGGVRLYVVGDVTIEGSADLDIQIESYESAGLAAPESGSTTIVLTDFSGSVSIRGAEYSVTVEGHMTLHGHGTGDVSLQGSGLWKTRTDQGVWPSELGLKG